MSKNKNWLGAWAFLIGVIIAIIFGFFPVSSAVAWILVIIGIVVGLLNISGGETKPFLLAGVALVIVSYLGGYVFSAQNLGINVIAKILSNLLALFVPATIIVALKSVFSMAED